MQHKQIFLAAFGAAILATDGARDEHPIDEDHALTLYGYARERNFPLPETLARKLAEFEREDFPFTSLAEAPEAVQAFFITFRAVALALEPFHEDDDVVDVGSAQLAGDVVHAAADMPPMVIAKVDVVDGAPAEEPAPAVEEPPQPKKAAK